MNVIREFYKNVPIMGICLGHQSIGYAFGGEIVRASRIMHGKTSPIINDGKTIFAGLPNPFSAGRYHSCLSREKHCLIVWRSAPKLPKVKSWDCGTGNIRWKAFSFIRNRC